MWDKVWDFFVDTMMVAFVPLVCSYHALTTDLFFNVRVQNATGLEWAGNTLLTPLQYLCAGREAIQKPDGKWELVQRFDYTHGFWIKASSSIIALPASLVLGSSVKALSFVNQSTREHFKALQDLQKSTEINSHLSAYQKIGMQIGSIHEMLISEGHQRRPGEEQVMAIEKIALKEIATLLNAAQIPWWVDCGTCLGTYRYGGVIPWDADIDIAVLIPDFQNVKNALNQLDPKKYMVQDWSSREFPNSYLKVYIKENGNLIDIYHYQIFPESKELQYLLSLENNIFFPEWWKIRERRFKVPVAFDVVFPLKKASFDGVEVFVPAQTKKYLQRYYGENISPAKIYDSTTCSYEKDLNHPYWQRVYAH
jgi:phosphorylcholine metabolism protein LicD